MWGEFVEIVSIYINEVDYCTKCSNIFTFKFSDPMSGNPSSEVLPSGGIVMANSVCHHSATCLALVRSILKIKANKKGEYTPLTAKTVAKRM